MKMDAQNIQEYFVDIMENERDESAAIAAIRTLMEIIKTSNATTVQGLQEQLREGIAIIKNTNYLAASIISGCDLFMCFISFVLSDIADFQDCVKIMLERGSSVIETFKGARHKIAKEASCLIREGSCILTHSRSRVVLQALKEAAKKNINFEVFVTISAPDQSGYEMCKDLEASNITCTPILSEAAAYVMERIHFVILGAEAIVESGGIVNKIGSYMVALCAKALNKPVYVLAESFKFTRLFPLNQQDIPNDYKYKLKKQTDLSKEHPLIDFTHPHLITLFYTDLGILTPTAVCDQIVQLYL